MKGIGRQQAQVENIIAQADVDRPARQLVPRSSQTE